MLALKCRNCNAGWRVDQRPAEVQQTVAILVGHQMRTLGDAIAHMCCPACDEPELQLLPMEAEHVAAG